MATATPPPRRWGGRVTGTPGPCLPPGRLPPVAGCSGTCCETPPRARSAGDAASRSPARARATAGGAAGRPRNGPAGCVPPLAPTRRARPPRCAAPRPVLAAAAGATPQGRSPFPAPPAPPLPLLFPPPRVRRHAPAHRRLGCTGGARAPVPGADSAGGAWAVAWRRAGGGGVGHATAAGVCGRAAPFVGAPPAPRGTRHRSLASLGVAAGRGDHHHAGRPQPPGGGHRVALPPGPPLFLSLTPPRCVGSTVAGTPTRRSRPPHWRPPLPHPLPPAAAAVRRGGNTP